MYSDKDGVATKPSQTVYESRIQILTLLASLLSLLGLLVSLIGSEYSGEKVYFDFSLDSLDWRNLLWLLIWFNSLGLKWKLNPITTYTAALRGSLMCVTLFISEVFLNANHNGNNNEFFIFSFSWRYMETGVAALLAIILILFPRRPHIFTPLGKPVDCEKSSSAFHQYTMQWCTAALLLAGKHVTLDELPALDYFTRSKSQPLLYMTSQKSLWNRILEERVLGFAKQWTLMFARSVVDFGSPYCVMRLLKSLEDGNRPSHDVWIWLLGIGVSSTCRTVIHHHLVWTQWSEMGIPVRAQLGMAVFQKMLRRKNSHDQSKMPKSKAGSAKADPINLISLDAVSFSKFTTVNYIIPSSFVRFFFAMVFLSRLLGWKSSFIGMAVTILCVPVYTLLIKKQRAAQKNLASARDRKTRVITEAMHALRQIKFSALETQWEEYIGKFRQEELLYMRLSFTITNIRLVWGVTAPFLVAAASVYAYTYFKGNITPSIIFPMIEVLPHLQSTLGFVPVVFQDYFGARSNASRMEEYLRRPEQERILEPSPSGKVSFKNASVAWPSDETEGQVSKEKHALSSPRFSLKNINLEFPLGELSVISGKTGSGKSLLLAAIIGEADLLGGRITAPSATESHIVAFVAQTPWLQNDTIKNNILFGSSFDKERYEKILAACALQIDLAALAKGDETQIGLRGVKLSGGQRARLAFARALYSRAKLLVLDDIFSSLDTHVSETIFKALTGELGNGRTRILVTHQVALCQSMTQYSVYLCDNTVMYANGIDSTREKKHTFGREHVPKQQSTPKEKVAIFNETTPRIKPAKNIRDSSARTDLNVYRRYFAIAGGIGFALIFVLGLVSKQLLNALTTWLLGRVNSNRQSNTTNRLSNSSIPSIGNQRLQGYFVFYIWSAASVVVLEFLFNIFTFEGSMRASKILSHEMTFRIIRMPLLWLDTTPIGVVLKSFTADTRMVDQSVLESILKFSECVVKLMTVVCVGLYTSMYHLILTVAVLIWCVQVSRRYLRARSFVKRADAGPTADILEHFTSCNAGIATIRAFGTADTAIDQMHSHLDRLSIAKRHFWIFNRWLGLQMSFIGILFSTGTGAILLLSKSAVGTSLMGALLTFSMGSSDTMFKAVDSFAMLETYMEAAKSIIGYAELETEDQNGEDVSEDWPTHGDIEVEGLEVAYSNNLPLVLKDVSFAIGAGQRLGIVGRTGAGKSSLTFALLRLLEPRNGSVSIDGIDISSIKLQSLRSRIAYIPQDPVLFSGTVRSNLDYFQLVPEERLQEALQRVGLLAVVGTGNKDSRLFTLDSPISEGGANMSQGQRQLLCLARVLIRNPKIIILDEATSAIDNNTDVLIQETIREEFKGTLIVVAHRLRTIVSFERVLVLREGRVVEFGRPPELLRRRGSFYNLVRDSKDNELLNKMILG